MRTQTQNYKQELGFAGERAAAAKYQADGYRIIALNYFNRRGKRVGEIDFIVAKENVIRFVEVKSRVAYSTEFALNDVNSTKRLKILLAIKYFLLMNQRYLEHEQHIDVAVVLFSKFDKSTPQVTIYSDAIDEV